MGGWEVSATLLAILAWIAGAILACLFFRGCHANDVPPHHPYKDRPFEP